jgi:hypothetical protein
MVTTCEKCGRILVAAPDPETFSLRLLPCQCGHVQMTLVRSFTDKPAVPTGRRAFPWLPEFPPR